MSVALTVATLVPALATSAELTLAWDPVADDRVAYYELHYGKTSTEYPQVQASTSTTATVSALDEGVTYYFAAKACNQDGTLCSAFSEEISTTTAYQPPSADFTLGAQSGIAPLTVTFSDASTGAIDTYAWDFGDGRTSTVRSPVHTYPAPGAYSVTLAVTGPGGASSTLKQDAVIVSHAPPTADFTESTANGVAPLLVTFQDRSIGLVDSYRWDFGDGATSSGRSAVHTYAQPGLYTVVLEVTGPGGIATKTKSDLLSVAPAAPAAAFTAASTTGAAPLRVQFSDASQGLITSYVWDFGDGSTSTESSPAHTYEDPGLFDVALTVTGPGGSDTRVQPGLVEVLPPELKIEVGEITVDHVLQRVNFSEAFQEPIVILGPVSFNGSDPVTARIERVDNDGFSVRLQKWEYLDDLHTMEAVGYIVLERGVHQLPGGSLVEAGSAEVDGDHNTELVPFAAEFSTPPVVLASVSTVNEQRPLTTRLQAIDLSGFEAQLQNEEANTDTHKAETVNYLAWEPACGEVAGLRFAVGATADHMTHSPSPVAFSSPCNDAGDQFAEPPVLIADMQTTDDPDTATLRWLEKTPESVSIWIDEETSADWETSHATESLGYLAIEPTTAAGL